MTAAERSALIDEGSGPPLVVFHGWNGSNHNVLRWLPALTPHFRVIAPDLPGCSGMPALGERHTAVAYARWAERLADSLGLGEFFAAGLCSGTAIAIALAGAAPSRVRGLLLHTPFLRPDLIRPAVRMQLRALVSPAGLLFGPLSRNTTLATLHRRIFANASEVDAAQLAHDQSDLLRADLRASRQLAADLLHVDRVLALRSFRGPLGVLLADHDAFIDAAATASLLREIAPRVKIEVIAGGHGWTPAYVAGQHAALERLAPALRHAATAR
ncbi:MAG TPA: alpha/beta fold hydrolase [Methylomirabilota bacterium]|nr:alpha/beta fold hydrolase [Methylomirabilota bacterium]